MPLIGTRGAASSRGFGRFGGGAAGVELIAPLGILFPYSGRYYCFNVDTESLIQLPQHSSGTFGERMAFDPYTGNVYSEEDGGGGARPYWTPNATKTNWDFAGTYTGRQGYNGRTGNFINNYHHHNVGQAGNSYNQIYGPLPGGGAVGSGVGNFGQDTEDHTAYGNVGFIHGYGALHAYYVTGSFTETSLGTLQSNWSHTSYDNRTGILFTMADNGQSGRRLTTAYSSGTFKTASETIPSVTSVSYSSSDAPGAIYNGFIATANTTSGTLSSTIWKGSLDSSGDQRWSGGSWNRVDPGVNYMGKHSAVYSYINKAYYMCGVHGYMKVTQSNGVLSTSRTTRDWSNVPGFVSGLQGSQWRGTTSTNGQLPIWTADKDSLLAYYGQ